jgi:two-component system response regulator
MSQTRDLDDPVAPGRASDDCKQAHEARAHGHGGSAAPATSRRCAMRSGTILLVEDNTMDEELTLRALKMSAVTAEVVIVRDGAAALDYLFATGSYAGRDTSALPTMVLLDLNLPKLGGLEVLRRIREDERTKLLPVVILTSSSEERDILQGSLLGSNAYVRKLMGFSAFAEAIRVLTVFWLTLNERLPARHAVR